VVNYSNFSMLNPESADLARDLLAQVHGTDTPFSSFIHAWMAFNGWMECVTEEESDAGMVSALCADTRLASAYEDLMGSEQFKRYVMEFSSLWPVLNVRDVRRKLGRDAFLRLSREELLQRAAAGQVRAEPANWAAGAVPTWTNLLRATYTVRCNLFHGSKSPQNYRDHQLVTHANAFLREFINRSACLEWVQAHV
jgi:hypothetical protein